MNERRLDSLHIENFRSITGRWTVPLDAQVVLVHGPNGAGKTSLLSAIELAATGSVGFLNEQSTELRDVLLNRNYPLGNVQLRLRSSDGSTLTGTITLDSSGIKGNAALGESEKLLFLERCFLPQTALGRLLETYTATGKQIDTALVRFVKSVVGLDKLDSLIDGLRPAGHLARARAASKSWEASENELTTALGTREDIVRQLERAKLLLAEAIASLRALYGDAVNDVPDKELLQRPLAVRSSNTGPDEANQYESFRVRLEGISAAYVEGIGAGSSHLDPAGQSEAANRAASAYVSWETHVGSRALAQLNQIRSEAFSLPHVNASQIFDAFEDCQTHLLQESRRRAGARKRKLEVESTRARLAGELDTLAEEIRVLEAATDAIEIPRDVRVLIDILEKTIPLVDSDVCPICDQHFAHDGASLRQHLEEKTTSLTRGAQDLMQARASLQSLQVEVARRTRELSSLAPPPEEDAPLDSLARDLNSLDEIISTGANLLKEMERTEVRKAVATSQKATQNVANHHLSALREELGIGETGLQISEEIERLAEVVEQRSQKAQYERTRQAREAEAIAAVEERSQETAELASRLSDVDSRISTLKIIIKEATDRKKAANSLRLETERIRSSVINHVFDQTLNTLWADLFSRFVPLEPFVPRFKKQTQAKRSVDIHLETVLPNGEVSGTPSSMLSYGNTNTAALSLFISLHLSAPIALPWLIFDDPVQSMDDIHVANFATVVRQLSYSHGRQVVIAVHQQELFEYLALELAPATAEESLLKVSLNRRGEATVIHTERVHSQPEPSLISST